ncbi:MAG: hypothetical protein JWR72_3135 [Flavisolibacter sp.]|jgi:hypothetical protein|nr:hypothetical protein [Flavisolibacter sp.]
MKKFLLAFSIIATSFVAGAQTGKNQLGIGAEVGVSTASGGGTAFGGTAKYMHGVGTAGQVTLTTGYLFDSEKEDGMKATASAIPVLLGYRHYFGGLYVEPQAGYISSRIKVKDEQGDELLSATDGAFGYAIGGGYAMANGLDLGVSFRNTAQKGASGGIIFRVGYNFSLGGSSK